MGEETKNGLAGKLRSMGAFMGIAPTLVIGASMYTFIVIDLIYDALPKKPIAAECLKISGKDACIMYEHDLSHKKYWLSYDGKELHSSMIGLPDDKFLVLHRNGICNGKDYCIVDSKKLKESRQGY